MTQVTETKTIELEIKTASGNKYLMEEDKTGISLVVNPNDVYEPRHVFFTCLDRQQVRELIEVLNSGLSKLEK